MPRARERHTERLGKKIEKGTVLFNLRNAVFVLPVNFACKRHGRTQNLCRRAIFDRFALHETVSQKIEKNAFLGFFCKISAKGGVRLFDRTAVVNAQNRFSRTGKRRENKTSAHKKPPFTKIKKQRAEKE